MGGYLIYSRISGEPEESPAKNENDSEGSGENPKLTRLSAGWHSARQTFHKVNFWNSVLGMWTRASEKRSTRRRLRLGSTCLTHQNSTESSPSLASLGTVNSSQYSRNSLSWMS